MALVNHNANNQLLKKCWQMICVNLAEEIPTENCQNFTVQMNPPKQQFCQMIHLFLSILLILFLVKKQLKEIVEFKNHSN